MKTSLLFASIALAAGAVSGAAVAVADERESRSEREHVTRPRHVGAFDHAMLAVPTGAVAGEAGHGWRYFSDPAAHRAVVISPQGDYYYSRGKGLKPVLVTQRDS